MDIRRDVDPTETQDWVDSLKAVSQHRGPERTNFLCEQLIQQGRRDALRSRIPSVAACPRTSRSAPINARPT
jgi:pyruvate dehydrogenase E1 component